MLSSSIITAGIQPEHQQDIKTQTKNLDLKTRRVLKAAVEPGACESSRWLMASDWLWDPQALRNL